MFQSPYLAINVWLWLLKMCLKSQKTGSGHFGSHLSRVHWTKPIFEPVQDSDYNANLCNSLLKLGSACNQVTNDLS